MFENTCFVEKWEKNNDFPSLKSIHSLSVRLIVDKAVDNVDKLSFQNSFSDFYYISGPHSYQQVAVD